MKQRLKYRTFYFFKQYLQFDEFDTKKILFFSLAFFFLIGAYSILRSLKTSVFLAFVGKEYEPISKILSIIITIPAMFIHSKVTDIFKKHHVVYAFIGFYCILIGIFSLLFIHPVYGIQNTSTSPYRFTGWVFEIAMDLFQALVVGTFWSFINSISSPQFASRSYGIIVAGSRIGGILTSIFGWLLLEKLHIPTIYSIPGLTFFSTILLISSLFCIHYIKKHIPIDHMNGYEATSHEEDLSKKKKPKTGLFEGLWLILTNPYVFGVFGLVFSYEVINIIFDYQMHVLMSIETNNQIGAMSAFMFFYTGSFQTLSLIFALFGTSTLLRLLGIQKSLFVMPIITFILALIPVLHPKLTTIFIVMVLLRALNYGFNHPLRELLFIPTTKSIRFKSKAWIESFGRTFSKTTGSTFNAFAIGFSPYVCLIMESFFSCTLASIWIVIAIFVGKKYSETIKKNAVIGEKDH